MAPLDHALPATGGAPAPTLPWPRRFLASGLFDLAGQQLVWWTAVALVRLEAPALAALPAVGLVALAAWARGAVALRLAGLGLAVGFAVDGLLVTSGAIALTSPLDAGVTASWMLGLWAAFGLAFGGSMRWLLRWATPLGAVFGAVAGVLAYRAGAALGVLEIPDGAAPLLAIGLGWGLGVTVLVLGARRLLGCAPEETR